MTRSLKKIAAVAAVAAFGLACCSTSADDADNSTNEDVIATDLSSLQKVDEIAALVPDEVAKDGKLTVGDNIYYAPAEFYAADGTTAQGYDIDIARALAAVMGLEADVQQPNMVATLSLVRSFVAFSAKIAASDAPSSLTYDICLPRTPPLALISSIAI